MRLIGPVSTMDRYTAPAMRAAFLVGCMNFSFVSRSADESNWSSVAMQPDCCAARNAAGNADPIQRPGGLRNFLGVSSITTGILAFGTKAKASLANPLTRSFSSAAKCEVSVFDHQE